MNAIAFVKKFGWNDARVCILNCANPQDRWLMRRGELIADQDFDDLKCIVESYVLIESYKGLSAAKEYRKRWFKLSAAFNYSKELNKYIIDQLDKLQKVIADVESVGGGV